MKKTNLFALLTVTLFTFISCENFLKGEDVKNEIVNVIEYNNAPSYPINVELFNDSDGKIKTPATGEVTKKVTDVFTVRFEPAANHTFIRWEADVKGLNAGEKIVDYIEFEDPESLETKVTFKKASSKVIVLRPVCPENLDVINFNLSDSEKEYPKDSSIVIKFNQPVAEDCINNISVKIPGIEEGKDYLSYFKAPELRNGNEIVINSDWDKAEGSNYIPVAANGNKTIIITIPKDKFYYVFDKGFEPIKVKLNNDLNYSYIVNSETSKQVNVKFFVDEDTKGILRVNEENANELSGKYSIGKKLNLRYKPNDGYIFDKWAVTRKYKDENGTDQTETIALDELNKINLQLTFPDNEDTLGYDSLSNVAQAVVTVDNYIDGTITISPVNKPRVGITFAVDDESQGTIKIGDKNLYNQDLQYSIGTAIQLKYKPAEGYIFSHWLFKAGNNEVLVNDASDAVLAALKSTFNLDFTCLEEGDITQASVTVGAYTGVAITVKPINKPRNKIQFRQEEDGYGTLKIDDIVSDGAVHQYSVGKTVNLKFKVNDGFKFRGWTVSKIVHDSQGKEQLEELADETYNSYLTFAFEDETLVNGYDPETKTASAKVLFTNYSSEALVISPDITQIPVVNIKLEVESGTGTTSPNTGTYPIREGVTTTVDFSPSGDYEFVRWEFFDTDGQKYDPYRYSDKDERYKYIDVSLSDVRSKNTTYIINDVAKQSDNSTIILRPVVAMRPKTISHTPILVDGGSRRDATIQVLFDHDMDPNSIYYDIDELMAILKKDDFKTLLGKDGKIYNEIVTETKDDDRGTNVTVSIITGVKDTAGISYNIDTLEDSIYGYTTQSATSENEIFFKNISIINNFDQKNLLKHFIAPRFENARTLSIPVDISNNRANVLPEYTQILVTINKDFYYEEDLAKVSLNTSEKWVYQVGGGENSLDSVPPVPSTTSFKVLQKKGSDPAEDVALKTVAPDTTDLTKLQFLENNQLYLDFEISDNGGLSNVFDVVYTKEYNKDYTPITGNKPSGTIGLSYTGSISSHAVYKGNIDFTELAEEAGLGDGVYSLKFKFSDYSGNTKLYPDTEKTENPDSPYYFTIDSTAPEDMDEPAIEDGLDANNSINITWANPSVDLKKTVIEYKKDGSTDYETPVEVEGKDILTKNLSLEGGQNYNFRVSYIDFNDNAKVYEKNFITRPNIPKAVVVDALNNTNGEVRAYGDTSVKIDCEKPDEGNFTNFRIRRRVRGQGDNSWVLLNCSDVYNNVSNNEYTGLLNGIIYEYEVCSYDSESQKYSFPYTVSSAYPTFTTKPANPSFKGLPATTYDSVANPNPKTEITYHYREPNSDFTKLYLYYRKGNESFNDTNRKDITANTTSSEYSGYKKYQLTGLTSGTQYYLKLVAYYMEPENTAESSADWVYTCPQNAESFTNDVSALSNNSITMKWTEPSSGLYSGYQLSYKLKTASDTTYTNVSLDKATTSYTLTGLKGGTEYSFKIKTKNAQGGLSPVADSPVVTVQTKPNPATNITAVKDSNSQITVSWTLPTDVYTGVKVYKSTEEDVSGAEISTFTDKTTVSKAFTGLTPGETYYFKVRSYISDSLYTDTEVVACSTSVNPVSSLSVTRSTPNKITVSWKNPDEFAGIRIYKNTSGTKPSTPYVTYSKDSTHKPNTADQCYISSLSPNTYYYVWVEVYKNVDGIETNVAQTSGVRTYSDTVKDASFTRASPTQVNLSWTNPTASSYNQIKIYNGSSCIATLSKGTTSYSITDLTPGTTDYNFYIKTTNDSNYVNSVSGYYVSATIATPPAAPTGLSVSTSTSSTATDGSTAAVTSLSWSKPDSGNVTGYYVYWGTSSSSLTNNKYVTATNTSINLAAGTQYYFKVESYVTGITNLTDGSSAVTTNCRTYPTAATSLATTSRSTTSISLQWKKPSGTFSDQILYYRKSTDSSWSSTNWLGTSATSTTINNLTPGATYYVYVYDYSYSTSYANSCSSITTYTTPEKPTNVKVVASNGGTKVSWTAPSGVVSGYYLHYKSGSSWTSKTVSGTSYTFGNTDLSNNTKYDFKVYSYATVSSSESSTVSFYTPPAQLTNGSVYQDDGMGTITVRFYTSASSTYVDVFLDGTYVGYTSYSGSGYKTYTYSIPNYSRGTYYTIRVAPYHTSNGQSGDTASWTQEYPNETYGTSICVYPGTAGNLAINGTYYSNSVLNKVITSRTYINNTTGTYALNLTDGAFPKNRYVYLSPYSIGAYEVTQDLFHAVMGYNPSTDIYSTKPVNNVSWYHAIAFCNKLSALHGLTPYYSVSGISNWGAITWSDVPTSDTYAWNNATYNTSANGYRLPTECEHEFAARGGSTSVYAWTYDYPGSNTKTDVAVVSANSGGYLYYVGSKASNRLGLYDMSGNIKEWLNDWNNNPASGTFYDPYCTYTSSATTGNSTTPSTLKKSESKVLLKGGYYGSNDNAWVDSNGDKWEAYKRDYSTGFRICRPKTY